MNDKEKILERIKDVIEYNYELSAPQSDDAIQIAIDNTAKSLIRLTECQYQMEFETEVE